MSAVRYARRGIEVSTKAALMVARGVVRVGRG